MSIKEFKKGNYVVYGTSGICVVEDITLMSFATGMEKSVYYILKPKSNSGSTVYVPADNEALMSKLRNLMTKDEIDSLLMGMRDKEFQWETDRRFRTENFHEILAQGVTQELLLMIRCLYIRKNELAETGKKLPVTDVNTLKAAEKLVEEEFSYVLGIKKENVAEYIRNLLEYAD